jgi:hypothetical protein
MAAGSQIWQPSSSAMLLCAQGRCKNRCGCWYLQSERGTKGARWKVWGPVRQVEVVITTQDSTILTPSSVGEGPSCRSNFKITCHLTRSKVNTTAQDHLPQLTSFTGTSHYRAQDVEAATSSEVWKRQVLEPHTGLRSVHFSKL